MVRSECPKGCYQMLCSIYIAMDKPNKFEKLAEKFGNFMSYDPEYHKTL
jgi:hypothetical protein